MSMFTRRAAFLSLLLSGAAFGADWTEPVPVFHDDQLCLTYRARYDGEFVAVQANIEPKWHTFAMDNKQRQAEKLAGKPSLGIERSTEIKVGEGLEVVGPWLQTPPKDFSKPEIRWYTWGFEQQALFAAKVKRVGAGPAKVQIRGQACSESICKNIDVTIDVALTESKGAPVDVKPLMQVR